MYLKNVVLPLILNISCFRIMQKKQEKQLIWSFASKTYVDY